MSLFFPMKKFKVEVFGNGKNHVWERCAMSLSGATLEALEAVRIEWPADGRLISVKQVHKFSDDSGHIALPMVVAGIAVYVFWFLISHGVFQAVTALQHGR